MSFVEEDWLSLKVIKTEIDDTGVTRIHLTKERRNPRSKVVRYDTWIEQGCGEDDSEENSLVYIQESNLKSMIKALEDVLKEIEEDKKK